MVSLLRVWKEWSRMRGLGVEVGKTAVATNPKIHQQNILIQDPTWHATPSKTVLTTSSPLPLKTLSVVATTFPPFLCKSHIMLRLGTCGNICWILSTSASLALTFCAALREPPPSVPALLKKKYRMARPPRTRIRTS